MSGQLTTHITVAMVAGLILAFPVIIWEFWQFFKPALHSNEAKYARGAVSAASTCFFSLEFFLDIFCLLLFQFIFLALMR